MMELKVTRVFTKNEKALTNSDIRFIVNMGGTRSSKTWSICQLIIHYCLINPGKLVSVVRKSFPSLRATVMRDLIEILNEHNLYDVKYHNKTENIYRFPNGSEIEFFSLDDSQKVRGRKRDLLFANEANELDFEEFNQLNWRTTDKLIFDFNPSDSDHFLYDLMEKPNAVKIHSTYKDNSFLDKNIIKEIEDLKGTNEELWRIYTLGLPALSGELIYSHFKVNSFMETGDTVLGLDFGYKHPTALIRCDFREDEVFLKELIYMSHLTSGDLVDEIGEVMKREGLSKSTPIVADWARPEMIEILRREGFYVINADKSVKKGIDAVKSYKVNYSENDKNISKELRNYKWKTIGGRVVDEPLKLWDDCQDSIRYAILYHKNTKSSGGWDFGNF